MLTIAATIQATVGFAAALFAMPLLIWGGSNLMAAQLMVVTAMLPQNVFGVWRLRHAITLQEVAVPATIRIAAMPIGILGLGYLMTWPLDAVNQFVGIMIIAVIVSQAWVGVEWKTAKRWYWVLITFGGSGILQGLSGMSGPPLVLWVHGQRYSADHARAFLFAIFISNFIPQLALLQWKFGNVIWQSVGIAVLALPFVLLGAMLGLRIGHRLGERWLRKISYLGLFCLGLSSLLAPWLKQLW